LYPDDTAPDLAGGATIGPLLLAIAVSASFSLLLLLLSTQCQYNFIGDQICSPPFSLPTLFSFPSLSLSPKIRRKFHFSLKQFAVTVPAVKET
jgi:hypothetical protein